MFIVSYGEAIYKRTKWYTNTDARLVRQIRGNKNSVYLVEIVKIHLLLVLVSLVNNIEIIRFPQYIHAYYSAHIIKTKKKLH